MFINLTSFVHMLNFVFIGVVVSFILVTGVQKPKKTSKFAPKMEGRRGRKALQRDRKDAHLGAKRRRTRIFGTNLGLGVS